MGSGKEEQGGHATDMAEIVVPDSYSGFARLLLHLYTGRSGGIRLCVAPSRPRKRELPFFDHLMWVCST